MRFFVLFEGLPVSDDDDVVICFLLGIERTLCRDKSGLPKNLAADKTTAFIAIGVLDNVTHFADGHFNIIAADAGFEFDHIGEAARQAYISSGLVDFDRYRIGE
jgi:hypothetical protein